MSEFSFIGDISALVKTSERDKSKYIPSLELAEKELLRFFEKVDYHYESGPDLYKKSSEARMMDATSRLNQSAADYRLGVGECVKYCANILDEFFKDYYIGRVMRLQTNNMGYLEVELSCLLHSGFGDMREAKEKQFAEQLRVLHDMGLTVTQHKTMSHKTIDATDNNMSIIKEMLTSREAKAIIFTLKRDAVDSVTFYLHPKHIENFKSNRARMVAATQEKLTNDEISLLWKNAREIIDSLQFVKEADHMANTCCFVAESCFVEMCKVVNHDCELRQRHTARFADEQARNAAIRDMDAAVGAAFPREKFQGVLELLRNNLTRFAIEKCKSFVRDLSIDKYGYLTANASWIPDAEDFIYYMDEELLSNGHYPTNSDFDEMFETVYIGPQQYLLDTEANRNTLLATIDEIGGCTISSFNVQVKQDPSRGMLHVIDKYEITVDYLSPLIRLYDSK